MYEVKTIPVPHSYYVTRAQKCKNVRKKIIYKYFEFIDMMGHADKNLLMCDAPNAVPPGSWESIISAQKKQQSSEERGEGRCQWPDN